VLFLRHFLFISLKRGFSFIYFMDPANALLSTICSDKSRPCPLVVRFRAREHGQRHRSYILTYRETRQVSYASPRERRLVTITCACASSAFCYIRRKSIPGRRGAVRTRLHAGNGSLATLTHFHRDCLCLSRLTSREMNVWISWRYLSMAVMPLSLYARGSKKLSIATCASRGNTSPLK